LTAVPASDLAEATVRLDVHARARRWLLELAAASQVRGTFHIARRLLIVGALVTAVGATMYATQLPPGHHTDDPSALARPHLSAQYTATPNPTLHVAVTARGVESRQHLLVTVFGTTRNNKSREIFRSVVGPKTDLTLDDSFDVPLEPGRFSVLRVGATTGRTPRSCAGYPLTAKGDDRPHQAANRGAAFSCIALHVPRAVHRPELSAAWTGDPTNPAITFDAKSRGLGSRSQLRVVVVATNSAPHVVYSSTVGPDDAGLSHSTSQVSVPPEDTILCVVARAMDSSSSESLVEYAATLDGNCSPESSAATAVVRIARPS
jgi:hypothetical protein